MKKIIDKQLRKFDKTFKRTYMEIQEDVGYSLKGWGSEGVKAFLSNAIREAVEEATETPSDENAMLGMATLFEM